MSLSETFSCNFYADNPSSLNILRSGGYWEQGACLLVAVSQVSVLYASKDSALFIPHCAQKTWVQLPAPLLFLNYETRQA